MRPLPPRDLCHWWQARRVRPLRPRLLRANPRILQLRFMPPRHLLVLVRRTMRYVRACLTSPRLQRAKRAVRGRAGLDLLEWGGSGQKGWLLRFSAFSASGSQEQW